MSETSKSLASACADIIALSSFFSQVPAPVARNALTPLPIGQGDYVLPFYMERRLAEALAFLAKTTDGPEHIPAVCVQQSLSGTVLNVILAVNKSTPTDGDGLLQSLKNGFEEIFEILHDSTYGLSSVYQFRKRFSDVSQKVESGPRYKGQYIHQSLKYLRQGYYLACDSSESQRKSPFETY